MIETGEIFPHHQQVEVGGLGGVRVLGISTERIELHEEREFPPHVVHEAAAARAREHGSALGENAAAEVADVLRQRRFAAALCDLSDRAAGAGFEAAAEPFGKALENRAAIAEQFGPDAFAFQHPDQARRSVSDSGDTGRGCQRDGSKRRRHV